MASLQEPFLKYTDIGRIKITRFFLIPIFVIFLFSHHKIPDAGVLDIAMELVSIILIFIGVSGRLWSTLFISGYKTTNLITVGPYSICRNPLYFFSFIAIIGIAMETEMITIILMVLLGFAIFYPSVILKEEKLLLQLHGKDFEEYCKRVPRFFPNFKLYTEPDKYVFETRLYRKAFFDSMWFILAYPLMEIIEKLHEHNILPTYLYLW
ncbi:MAG TPA: methyltransferase [Verrucomicrobiota bacterium]|nr:methyltransferase [Verrucomicrobiota bacterium]